MLRYCFKLFINKPLFCFSSFKEQKFIETYKEFIKNSHKYNPVVNIQLLHNITMAKYDPQLIEADSLQKKQILAIHLEDIYSKLSPQLHTIPHKSFNLLLEVFKERDEHYDRNRRIYRTMYKILRNSLGSKSSPEFIFKTLCLVKDLEFPKIVFVKLILSIINNEEGKYQLKVPGEDILNICILSLQQPYMPFGQLKKLIQIVVKVKLNSLQQYAKIYHLSQILMPCMKRNIQYNLMKNNAREILFNPYKDMEEEAEANQTNNPSTATHISKSQSQATNSQHSHQTQDSIIDVRQSLNQISNNIHKIFVSAIDQNKLEQEIVQLCLNDPVTIKKTTYLYVCSISQLNPLVSEFIHRNYQKLTPVEFIHLIRQIQSQGMIEIFQKYMENMVSIMSLQEKVYLHIQFCKITKNTLKSSIILQLLSNEQSINYQGFLGVMKLIGYLSKEDEKDIEIILKKVQFLENNDNSREKEEKEGDK